MPTRGGQKLKRAIKTAKAARGIKKVQIGFFETARYPNGIPVASVAAWNEFGRQGRGRRKGVPARPFFRKGAQAARTPVNQLLYASLNPRTMVVDKRLAHQVGDLVAGSVKETIVTVRKPPNTPYTVRKKGSSNPLIDTTRMMRSASYRVVP